MATLASWKNALLTIGAAAVSLAAGELACRLFLHPPYSVSRNVSRGQGVPRFARDPELGWINDPTDAAYRFQPPKPPGAAAVTYNLQAGLRRSAPQPAAGPTVAITGDSFTFGFGLDDQDTWPWLLRERLQNRRVANLATNAYGVAQSLLRVTRFESQSPAPVQTVIYAFADFHVERDRGMQHEMVTLLPAGRPRIVKSGGGVKNRGLVYFLTPGPFLEHSSLLMHVLNRYGDLANGTPGAAEANEIALRCLKEFARHCRERKINFLVVVLPHGKDRKPLAISTRKFILQGLRDSGIAYLEPDIPRLPDDTFDNSRYLIPSDDFHPNRQYNQLLAGTVARYLAKPSGDVYSKASE